jgi:hypothetical protein
MQQWQYARERMAARSSVSTWLEQVRKRKRASATRLRSNTT